MHHYALVNVIEGWELTLKEQEMLDEHDEITELAVRIKGLISLCAATPHPNFHKVATRQLTHISKGVSSIAEAIGYLSGTPDVCFLYQYKEQICDHKRELGDMRDSLLSQDLADSDELYSL